ncbi:MAG: gluconate 2-dehydrogenase subunit 3 family protein [Archangium sp.]|nr:gluconate 2-dehydrogenase subunit 3 family protein [Archangium sp.]
MRDDEFPSEGQTAPAEHDPLLADLPRRVFVRHLTFLGGGVVLLESCKDDKKPDAGPPAPLKQPVPTISHKSFTDPEWATLVAVIDRFLPKDEDPGGVELGVPDYIDRMLQDPTMQQMKTNFPTGLAALDRRAQRMFQKNFASCTAAQQDELLTIFKNSGEKTGEARWYEMLVVLSLEGYLGDPNYGGNKDGAGWKTVGFELVGRNLKGDPKSPYDGSQRLHQLVCGGGKGC